MRDIRLNVRSEEKKKILNAFLWAQGKEKAKKKMKEILSGVCQ